MSNDELRESPDPRYIGWFGATIILFLVAVVVGFVWIPSAQPGAGELGLWGVICRAVGLPIDGARSVSRVGLQTASNVAWTTATRKSLSSGSAVRGAELATTCNSCHGVKGISTDAIIPNLAGLHVAAIYKQLADFKSGKRNAAVMGVYVASLSEQDMLDLAAHFASLPSPLVKAPNISRSSDSAARQLIEVGNPMHGIAPCAACHGPSGQLLSAPALQGQQRAYLEQQLQAFAEGSRHNDINEQMRSVARQLSGADIASLAAYYAGFTRP